MLSESEANPVYWTEAQVDAYVNDAYQQAARDTGALEIAVAVAATADTQGYTAPDTMRWPPLRATYDGHKLYSTTKWELDRVESDWENQSGYVSHYVTTLMDDKQFRLYKAPDGTAGVYEFSGEYGIVQNVAGATMTGDYGFMTAFSEDGTSATFVGEYGLVVDIDGGSTTIRLYGKHVPDALEDVTDEPLLPAWTHPGLAFAAAAKALRKHGEQRDDALSAFYAGLAKQYVETLKGVVASRAPERNYAMSAGPSRVPRRPRPQDQTIED